MEERTFLTCFSEVIIKVSLFFYNFFLAIPKTMVYSEGVVRNKFWLLYIILRVMSKGEMVP